MGDMVEFPVNGTTARGYLALPSSTPAPGLLVIQEWWGLVPQIKGCCDRLAAEGFVALAPDLYHGDIAEHTEMDKANKLMTEMPPERAAKDMSGAITHLLSLDATSGSAVGVIGFCMGGMLSLIIAAQEGDRVAAVAPFYGAPIGDGGPDFSGLTAKVDGHFAEQDGFFGADAVRELEQRLQGMGKDVTFNFYPGTEHAFANEENPIGTYSESNAADAWSKAVAFLRANV